MTFLQRLSNWIRGIKLSPWMSDLFEKLQDLIVEVITGVGEMYLRDIEKLVIEASRRTDLSGTERFDYVVDRFKEIFVGATLTDRAINLAVELIYNRLRDSGIVRSAEDKVLDVVPN